MPILSEGQNILEAYEEERFLGYGEYAEFYRVKHRILGRQSMKVFKAAGMTLADIEEALGETILLFRIGHPKSVRVCDANIAQTNKVLFGFFTMNNVLGGSLKKIRAITRIRVCTD
jgi:serine/threonine-protein kinase